MKQIIKKAKLGDFRSILNVLVSVKEDLHYRGITQWTEGFNEIEILTDINLGRTFIVVEAGEVMGTFSIKSKQIDLIKKTMRVPFLYFYQLAIHPNYQGQSRGDVILKYAVDFAKRNECDLFLDCWSQNEKLKSFYQNQGFVYVENKAETDYEISIFKYEG